MFHKIILVALATLLCTPGVKNEGLLDLDSSLAKLLVEMGFKMAPLEVLSNSITEFSASYNVTLAASQNIHNPDGSLKEILSFELDIPMHYGMENKSEEKSKKKDEEYEDIYSRIEDFRDNFQTLSNMGLPIKVSYEEYDNKGELTNELYLEDDLIYLYDDAMGYMNKTIRAAKSETEEIIKKYESKSNLPIAVLRFDVDGNFVAEGSIIAPTAITSVVGVDNAENGMVEAAFEGFSLINLQHPNDIPKNMALYMKERFPGYYWHVTGDADGYYLDKDVCITVQNELIDVVALYKPYKIFGAKKE